MRCILVELFWRGIYLQYFCNFIYKFGSNCELQFWIMHFTYRKILDKSVRKFSFINITTYAHMLLNLCLKCKFPVNPHVGLMLAGWSVIISQSTREYYYYLFTLCIL